MIETFSWHQMSPENSAQFAGLLGPKIVRMGDIYWGEVRTFFYRPVLPLIEHHPDSIHPPFSSLIGGIQYAVPPDAKANSVLNWLLFDRAGDYSLDSLDKNRRRQVRLAGREYSIRALTDVLQFKEQAYPVYLSFYERTRYKVGARRRDQTYFGMWADALFRIPNVLVLGAFRDGALGGVSLSYQVKDTVYYATFFCNNDALDRYLSDLMLHTVRGSAAAASDVRQIFVGMFKGIRGLDDFYLHRGAKLVRQRAMLRVNPMTRFLLRSCMPKQYAQLLGHLPLPEEEVPSPGNESSAMSGKGAVTSPLPIPQNSVQSVQPLPPDAPPRSPS